MRVAAAVDRDVCDLSDLVGLRGTVVHLEYDCGCGQHYPDDPMVGVRLETLEVVEFWKEELARESEGSVEGGVKCPSST